jgi:tungstate transport system substrate-binding protein
MSKRLNKRSTIISRIGKAGAGIGVTALILAVYVLLAACSPELQSKELTLATTTSVNDSGLLEYLTPILKKDTGINLKIIAQGTGQAIKTGENGDADVLLVHDKASEEKFVSEGFGVKRIEFMYNYFVMVGPMDDQVGLKGSGEADASAAFKKIAQSNAVFVSRGDNSGTHKKELSLWKAAGLEPSGGWYVSAGKGMGDVLMMASEKKAYTLTDKATFLAMKDKLELQMVLENAKDLLNQYSVIAVNPEKHSGINKQAAAKFIEWLTSDRVLGSIEEFCKDKYGANLFYINSSGKK